MYPTTTKCHAALRVSLRLGTIVIGLQRHARRKWQGRVHGVSVLDKVVLVHETIATDFADEGRLLAALDAPVLQQGFAPLVALATDRAGEATIRIDRRLKVMLLLQSGLLPGWGRQQPAWGHDRKGKHDGAYYYGVLGFGRKERDKEYELMTSLIGGVGVFQHKSSLKSKRIRGRVTHF